MITSEYPYSVIGAPLPASPQPSVAPRPARMASDHARLEYWNLVIPNHLLTVCFMTTRGRVALVAWQGVTRLESHAAVSHAARQSRGSESRGSVSLHSPGDAVPAREVGGGGSAEVRVEGREPRGLPLTAPWIPAGAKGNLFRHTQWTSNRSDAEDQARTLRGSETRDFIIADFLFGITSNTLVRSSQSSSGPAGGASDGCGLGRGAAGPDRRCTTTAAGALRVID